jgi:RNA polymerase sigma-70 factor (ECF subfamily)
VLTAATGAAVARPSAEEAEPLVLAAMAGDRGAFAQLYTQYARTIHGILLSRVPRLHVEDLVQDVFMMAMQRLSSLRNPAAFGGWLAAIARNQATDHLRSAPRTTELPDSLPDRHPNRTEATVEATAVMEIIRNLPEAYRETLTLRLVEGMTGPEISARTSLSEGSVRVNLHRGMKLLRERLEGRSA